MELITTCSAKLAEIFRVNVAKVHILHNVAEGAPVSDRALMMPRAAALSRTPGEQQSSGKLFERSETTFMFPKIHLVENEAGWSTSIVLHLKYIFLSMMALVHFYEK